MFKKVYVEITNNCNLDCKFCIRNHRPNKFMKKEEFETILLKLNGYTDYLYFHILGEPLLHPQINEFIDLASQQYKINITTNGYLIKRIKDNKNIRQINISLHSFDEKYKVSLNEYMYNIFEVVDNLRERTYISLRFWVNSIYSKEILDLINKKYDLELSIDTLKDNTKITTNVYLSTNQEFIWPDLNNNFTFESGCCYALKHHLGILVDGTIVPCCLDSKGDIALGNIFENSIDEVINSLRYQNMLEGFKKNKKIELLCKKCPIDKNIKKFNKVSTE